MFADGLEDGQEMGDTEEVADGFAHIGDFKRAACRFGVDVESNQRAEAAAIHVREMLEVENDSLGARKQLADLDVELLVDSGDQAARAVDHDEVIVAFNGEGEVVRALIGHFDWNLPLTVWDFRRAIVTYCGAERKRRLRSSPPTLDFECNRDVTPLDASLLCAGPSVRLVGDKMVTQVADSTCFSD